jgi:hypothetical protein
VHAQQALHVGMQMVMFSWKMPLAEAAHVTAQLLASWSGNVLQLEQQ